MSIKEENVFEGINEMTKLIYSNNRDKGFWDDQRSLVELLMLTVSELSEAVEALRKNRRSDIDTFKRKMSNENNKFEFKKNFEEYVKDSFEDEIADAVIRLFDMCGGLGIDLESHIENKVKYNVMRDRLHGKIF